MTTTTIPFIEATILGALNADSEVQYEIFVDGRRTARVTFPFLGSYEATVKGGCCYYGQQSFCTPDGILTEIHAHGAIAKLVIPQ